MNRRWILLGLPAALGACIVALSIGLRSRSSEAPPKARPEDRALAGPADLAVIPTPARRTPPPTPAPASEVARATDQAELRTAYQNYRTAVATGNAVLARRFQEVLCREREAALTLARADLSGARTSQDRDIATKALEGLRR